MYGTIARMRAKPGTEDRLRAEMDRFEEARVPGSLGVYIYRMDADPQEYYLAVIFADREAYRANAESPEQNTRFQALMELMAGEPEWHDGEIVAAHTS
jgi:quinol monooxygenase YgiN